MEVMPNWLPQMMGATILGKINEKFRPLPPHPPALSPKSRTGKWSVLTFARRYP